MQPAGSDVIIFLVMLHPRGLDFGLFAGQRRRQGGSRATRNIIKQRDNHEFLDHCRTPSKRLHRLSCGD